MGKELQSLLFERVGDIVSFEKQNCPKGFDVIQDGIFVDENGFFSVHLCLQNCYNWEDVTDYKDVRI